MVAPFQSSPSPYASPCAGVCVWLWGWITVCSPFLTALRCLVKHSLHFSGVLAVSRGRHWASSQAHVSGCWILCGAVAKLSWSSTDEMVRARAEGEQPRWTKVVPREVCSLRRWHEFVTGFSQHCQGPNPSLPQANIPGCAIPAKPSHISSTHWDFLLDEQLILTPCR